MPILTANLIEDSGLTEEYSPVYTPLYGAIRRATRMYLVSGLDDGSPDAAETMLARATLVSGLPVIGQLYDALRAPGCMAVRRSVSGITQVGDSAIIRVDFDTILPPTGGTYFTVTDDSNEVPSETSLHPKDFTQMVVRYRDPTKGTLVQKPVSVSYPQSIRRLILKGPIIATSVAQYRRARGCVNAAPFYGLPAGCWKLSRWSTETGLTGGVFQATAELTTMANDLEPRPKTWMQYSVFYSEEIGQYVTIDAGTLNILYSLPYTYGWEKFDQGITRIGNYPLADLTSLFNVAPD